MPKSQLCSRRPRYAPTGEGYLKLMTFSVQPFMILNPFLCPHADEIIRRIQTRSIIQYIEPFSSIKIETMATAFGMSADDTLKVVESLVESKQINGRIDLIDMVSYSPSSLVTCMAFAS